MTLPSSTTDGDNSVPVCDSNGKIYDRHLPEWLSEANFDGVDFVGALEASMS